MKSGFYVFVKGLIGIPAKGYFRLHIHGSENEPTEADGPYIIASNHVSNADPVFLCLAVKHQQPHFMAKKELFKVPVINKLVSALGAYPVDRGGADVGAIKKTIRMLEEGKCIGIFPQGHRQKGIDPEKTEVKNGIGMVAAKAGATVLPCYIKMKKRRWALFRRVDVYVGEPIPFKDFNYDPEASGEYARISKQIFERICTIGKGVEDGSDE